ncbi:GNAT family N-acetyltransferase [Peribacillus alkalitolerans]|uniref:GNAT family N-acetyltransferase n=1 Tax=Peribacillus alkalitolerans TaxID=1550385 RepID=UPI0013D7E76C|nr:GNAT family N-acetyltransferase [Peribacillus alkalitolerans]
MERDYKKIPYFLEGQEPIKHITSRLQFKKVTKDLEEEFKENIGKIIIGSLDSMDQRLLDKQATIEELVDEYWSVDENHFVYKKDWWKIAYLEGTVVGITQPVVYKGSERDGLVEGTIHYIGVLPEHRGQGYIIDLLQEATETLKSIGVWRIFSDTDINNLPMRNAFEKVGYSIWRKI